MRFLSLKLIDFRNLPSASVEFGGGDGFFVGSNGQGKTNLLEALGLVTALRSFRTQELRSLPRWNSAEGAQLLCTFAHEREGETTMEIHLHGSQKSVLIDGIKVPRWQEFLGRYPTVAFTSQDIQLLRGAPQLRRRYLDMMLAAVDAEYYTTLRNYHQALKERNRLLKERSGTALLSAFERVLAPAAASLVTRRRTSLQRIVPLFEQAYATISGSDEQPEWLYRPDQGGEDESFWLDLFARQRDKDLQFASTQNGPHRDDFALRLFARQAREYGSEGQQRGLVLALRMAQAHWYHQHTGVEPVILADDILNELDPQRREGFWRCLPPTWQIIASGTSLPSQQGPRAWNRWRVESGTIVPLESAKGAAS